MTSCLQNSPLKFSVSRKIIFVSVKCEDGVANTQLNKLREKCVDAFRLGRNFAVGEEGMRISLNECANLVRLDDGSVVVLFDKRHYECDDPVPIAILGENYRLDARPEVFRASHFVEICMRGKFGAVDLWPTAAGEFVYSKAPRFNAEINTHAEEWSGQENLSTG